MLAQLEVPVTAQFPTLFYDGQTAGREDALGEELKQKGKYLTLEQ